MTRRLRSIIVLGVFVALIAGIAFGATRAKTANALKVNTGTLKGVVADTSGKALPKMTLCLKQGKKIVLKVLTDKAGKFELKGLAAGKYLLTVGAERALGLEVASDTKVASLQIVVPSSKPYAAAIVAESQWVWAVAGTGAAAVAVSVPIIGNEQDWFDSDSSDDTVSP